MTDEQPFTHNRDIVDVAAHLKFMIRAAQIATAKYGAHVLIEEFVNQELVEVGYKIVKVT